MSLALSSNLSANDDEKNPCGALLCILGGQTSGECSRYYKYYTIGIYNESLKECQNRKTHILYGTGGPLACFMPHTEIKRIAHLKNCKLVGADSAGVKIDSSLADTHGVTSFTQTQNFNNKINQMSGVTGECTQSELNRVEKKLLNNFSYAYRINPSPTKNCEVLAGQTYSAIKISYTCDKKWYNAEDWNNGFEKQLISKAEYDNLNSNDRGTYITYGKKINTEQYSKLSSSDKTKYKLEKEKYEYDCANVDEYGNWTNCNYDYNYYYQEIITNYYKKNYIKKDCWKVEQRVYN